MRSNSIDPDHRQDSCGNVTHSREDGNINPSAKWPIVDKIIAKHGSEYARSIGLSVAQFSQLSGTSIPEERTLEDVSDEHAPINPWDIYPWSLKGSGDDTIYENAITGKLLCQIPPPIFEEKLHALAQITPRKEENKKQLSSSFTWREGPSDRRRRLRHEQRLKKAEQEENFRRRNSPTEKEQIQDVLIDIVISIQTSTTRNEALKSHQQRKKLREQFHPSTKGFTMKRLSRGGQKEEKALSSRTLVTDVNFEEHIITMNGELLPSTKSKYEEQTHNVSKQSNPVSKNVNCIRESSCPGGKSKLSITLACSAPNGFKKLLVNGTNENGEKIKKHIFDKSKRTNFENQLCSEIASLGEISQHNVIIDEIINHDTRHHYLLKGSIISNDANDETNRDDYVENESRVNQKSKSTERFIRPKHNKDISDTRKQDGTISKPEYSTKDRFLHEHYVNELVKKIPNSISQQVKMKIPKINIVGQPNIQKKIGRYSFERSEHKRCTVMFVLLDADGMTGEKAARKIVEILKDGSSSTFFDSLIVDCSIENIGHRRLFEQWETYWSHIIHPCFFGYVTKKKLYKRDAPLEGQQSDKVSKQINEISRGNLIRIKKNNSNTINKGKTLGSSIPTENMTSVEHSPSTHNGSSMSRRDDKIDHNVNSFDETTKVLFGEVGPKKRPDRLFHRKKKETPAMEKQMMKYITDNMGKNNQDRNRIIEFVRAHNLFKDKKDEKLISASKSNIENMFQMLQTKIYKVIASEKDKQSGSISKENALLFLASFMEDHNMYKSHWVMLIISETIIQETFMKLPVRDIRRICPDEFICFFYCLYQIITGIYREEQEKKEQEEDKEKKQKKGEEIKRKLSKMSLIDSVKAKTASIFDKSDSNTSESKRDTKKETKQSPQPKLASSSNTETKNMDHDVHAPPKPSLLKQDKSFNIYRNLCAVCEDHCPRLSRFFYKGSLSSPSSFPAPNNTFVDNNNTATTTTNNKRAENCFLGHIMDPSNGCEYVIKFLSCETENDLERVFWEANELKISCSSSSSLVKVVYVDPVVKPTTCIHEMKNKYNNQKGKEEENLEDDDKDCNINIPKWILLVIVMEWCPGGSIIDFCKKHLSSSSYTSGSTQSSTATITTTNIHPCKQNRGKVWIKWTSQILQGLHCMHSCNLIHRNINPGNIYLDSNHNAKLGGFMLCKASRGPGCTLSYGRCDFGSPIYYHPNHKDNDEKNDLQKDPNKYNNNDHHKAADIWAFGCSLFVWMTGRFPDLERFTISEEMQYIPLDYDKRLSEVIRLALNPSIKQRASAEELMNVLLSSPAEDHSD